MAKLLFPYILCWTLLTQSANPEPIKIRAATQLTEQDIEAIKKLLPAEPWLLDVSPTQLSFRQYVEAYLPPMTRMSSIRRGTVIPVWRTIYLPNGQPTTGAWTSDQPYEYAQVAIPGRPFDEIRNEYDLSRPFRVVGRFEDEDVIGIVNLIRSKAGAVQNGEIIGAWPIRSIDHGPDGSIRVMTWEKFLQGQSFSLRREGNNWLITVVAMWIA